jgi:hypothetical protein
VDTERQDGKMLLKTVEVFYRQINLSTIIKRGVKDGKEAVDESGGMTINTMDF